MKKPAYLKILCPLVFLTLLATGCRQAPPPQTGSRTICNPVDISYRFQPDQPSRREAADPTVVRFRGHYFLFASKSGGYWHSADLARWDYIPTDEIPVEEYAPTAVAIGDTLFFLASSTTKSTLYKTTDPGSGKWTIAVDSMDITVWDPALFLDDNRKLYMYWGCSNKNPIYGIELDYRNHFKPVGERVPLIYGNPGDHGWEVPGDYNTKTGDSPWIEGAWMNKQDGKYYLQYAGPGTEFKSYSDGVYVSEEPLGPFVAAAHNPFSYKPEGFTAGAGHGSTFSDKYGNYWHIATSTISVKHVFERRLGLYPAFFDGDGNLFAVTKFGDYPLVIPDRHVESFNDLFPGWMLLSWDKNVAVSSTLEGCPAENMTDENIRTHWSARSGNDAEWATIDLGTEDEVFAIQVNFADQNTEIFGRQPGLSYRYFIDASGEDKNWKVLIDKSESDSDNSHAYLPLDSPGHYRYIRIRNVCVPGGFFALSGFRVFGRGNGPEPARAEHLSIKRNPADRRIVRLSWSRVDGATGYNIGYGSEKNRLYLNRTVYGDTIVDIRSLDTKKDYFFTVEAFNENGISLPGKVEKD